MTDDKFVAMAEIRAKVQFNSCSCARHLTKMTNHWLPVAA